MNRKYSKEDASTNDSRNFDGNKARKNPEIEMNRSGGIVNEDPDAERHKEGVFEMDHILFHDDREIWARRYGQDTLIVHISIPRHMTG